jgi:microcystin degradation protein MlrC
MRVGIIGLLHESNTFITKPTTLAYFQRDCLCQGEAVRTFFRETPHEIAGFFEGLESSLIEAVPIFAARAIPSGAISRDSFDTILSMMFDNIAKAGTLEGLLIAPHGAAVVEGIPDADGYWMSILRNHFPRPFPIICTLDLHGNLSQKMVDACDAILPYRTNPHLDQKVRGIEAATLMKRVLDDEVKPVIAACFPPLAVNIERQHTPSEPCLSMYSKAKEYENQLGVLHVGLMLGFPYSDVPEMGSAICVTVDGSRSQAQQIASQLGEYWWSRREEFDANLISPKDAVRSCLDSPGTTCLLDMGDNVGGGSAADGTTLLFEMEKKGCASGFICLYDPASVQRCATIELGKTIELCMGGKSDELHGKPFTSFVELHYFGPGMFEETETRHGGIRHYDQGITAIVKTPSGITIMLTSERMVPFSLSQLTAFGLNPKSFQIIVAKGVHAPTAAYAPVCDRLVRVNTPGSTSADMKSLIYQSIRRPIFPLDREIEWSASSK